MRAVALAALLAAGCATGRAPAAAARVAEPPAAPERGAAAHGLEVQSVRLTAAGWMLDVRFRVVDPVRAARVLSRGVKPVLVDPATGAELVVPAPPKVGALRQAPRGLRAGRTYFVLFRNDRGVQRGQHLSLVMGELEQEVVVE